MLGYLLLIFIFLFDLMALLDLSRLKTGTGNKVIYAALIIILPVIGPSIYYIFKLNGRM